jgi:adenylate cyclase
MGKLRIVIVDDNEELLQELGETLALNDCDVETVKDPDLAAGVIEEILPDIVLLDLRMKHKSGLEIAEALSRSPETSGIPVIAMTGLYDDEDIGRLTRLGTVKGFLTKPFAVADVIAKVGEARRPL